MAITSCTNITKDQVNQIPQLMGQTHHWHNYWQLMSTGRRATFLWYGDPEGLPITVQRDGLPPYAHTGQTK